MTYSVQLSPRAVKQYQRLDPPVRANLRDGLDALQHQPLAGPKITRLKGRLREYLRCRIGDYRIVYTVDTQKRIVSIDYIQHRKDVYRDIA